MKILKLKLRGAIGIRKGLGVDQIEINFTQFQPGLIALTGRNGSGKTTIMENLHPYRQMVSRDGSLQSHFYLKDSYRILEFEYDGHQYLSKILIDALTGGSEAYLLRDTDKGFSPLNDGKLTTYDEAIEKLLGSPELFFNSVFSGQKSKGIAELKPADRRKLFYELLNLNSYESYLERAKGELKSNEIELARIEGEIKSLENSGLHPDELKDAIKLIIERIKSTVEEQHFMEGVIEKVTQSIQDFEVHIRTNEEAIKQNEQKEARLKEILAEIEKVMKENNAKLLRLDSDLDDCKMLLDKNRKILANKNEIESAITTMNFLEENIKILKEKKSSLLETNSIVDKSYSSSMSDLKSKEEVVQQEIKNRNEVEAKLKSLEYERDHRIGQIKLIDEVPCDEATGSSCKFLMNAYESKKLLEGSEEKIKELSLINDKMNEQIGSALVELEQERKIIEGKYRLDGENIHKELTEINSQIKTAAGNLEGLTKQNFRQQFEQLKEAEHNIELLAQKIGSIELQKDEVKKNRDKIIYALNDEERRILGSIDKELPVKVNEMREALSKARMELQSYKSKLAIRTGLIDELRQDQAKVEQTLLIAEENKTTLERLNNEKIKVHDEIKDWTFLTKAFDKTGIPVLKLENSGIEITSIANELLSLFENKFRIVFETTSLTKDKKKMKETFDINIVEEDGVCEIGNKSGGQQVWLETAIQLAIMILLSSQGKKAETAFLDEKDGALDLDNAFSYIEMIKKAHQLSGVYNTFLITHRSELLDFIPQQVKLTNGILEVMN